MNTHILKIEDSTTFKEIAHFIRDNKVKAGDEISLSINVTYDFNFIIRQVFFITIRESISNNLQAENLKRLPETKQNITEFWEHDIFEKALLEDTGVLVSVK